jgi:hypothetical protein
MLERSSVSPAHRRARWRRGRSRCPRWRVGRLAPVEPRHLHRPRVVDGDQLPPLVEDGAARTADLRGGAIVHPQVVPSKFTEPPWPSGLTPDGTRTKQIGALGPTGSWRLIAGKAMRDAMAAPAIARARVLPASVASPTDARCELATSTVLSAVLRRSSCKPWRNASYIRDPTSFRSAEAGLLADPVAWDRARATPEAARGVKMRLGS